jgi:hypothetical protein
VDLHDTRRIPMWLAHPALPVAAGALLLGTLVALQVLVRQPLPADDAPPKVGQVLGPERAAGTLRHTAEPSGGSAFASAAKEARSRERRGDYQGALEVLAALSAEEREAHAQDLLGWEQRCVGLAYERLQLRLRKLDRAGGVAALSSFLALESVRGQPAEAKAQADLARLGAGAGD